MTKISTTASPPELAIISLKALASDDHNTRTKEINRFRNAIESVGLFYLSDHGVPSSLANRIMKSSREFFSLPLETKNKWAMDKQVFFPRTLRGYAQMGAEQLFPDRDIDFKETFEFGHDRPLEEGKPFTGPTIAPQEDEVADFAKSNMEYVNMIIKDIAPKLIRALALSLGLEETFFLKDVSEEEMLVTERIARYPPRNGGCGRHTDSSIFTIILHEAQKSETPSLKVFKEGHWFDVKGYPDLLTVNTGNMLQYWTNKKYMSAPHVVVHEGEMDRISVPVFIYPNYNAKLTPLGKKPGKDTVKCGEVYLNDLLGIWEKGKGAGFWNSSCSGEKCNPAQCWECN